MRRRTDLEGFGFTWEFPHVEITAHSRDSVNLSSCILVQSSSCCLVYMTSSSLALPSKPFYSLSNRTAGFLSMKFKSTL